MLKFCIHFTKIMKCNSLPKHLMNKLALSFINIAIYYFCYEMTDNPIKVLLLYYLSCIFNCQGQMLRKKFWTYIIPIRQMSIISVGIFYEISEIFFLITNHRNCIIVSPPMS